MRKVELRMNEILKYETIKELVDHKGNKNRAAKKLGISRRQVDRLIIKYKEKGKAGFVHGNRTHKPYNAFDNSISENIILHYKNKYYDFNFNHFKKFLEEKENIKVSYNFIYKTLTKEGILSPKARRKTKRKFAKQRLLKEKKINLAMTDEQINTIINHEVALEDAHPRGEKPKYFGEIIEQDGSIHLWFSETKTCLHLAIDKATSTVVGPWFDYQELNDYDIDGAYGYLQNSKILVPKTIYNDDHFLYQPVKSLYKRYWYDVPSVEEFDTVVFFEDFSEANLSDKQENSIYNAVENSLKFKNLYFGFIAKMNDPQVDYVDQTIKHKINQTDSYKLSCETVSKENKKLYLIKKYT